jgi:GNAT superfamily N-acetyltransferase
MNFKACKTELQKIQPLRTLFLQENNFQIRYHACHERGWSDSYLLTIDDASVGYGSIKGKDELKHRNAVFEFYVLPPFRKLGDLLFSELLKISGAVFIECQSNDFFLSSMLYSFSHSVRSEVVLFNDHTASELHNPGVVFRRREEKDRIFEHKMEPVGNYVVERSGEVVATGGFLLHYNIPFADLYMEVSPECRKQGLGSYLLQELKKECYQSGRVPAARCNIENKASKAALIKAGMKECGFMLTGEVRQQRVSK